MTVHLNGNPITTLRHVVTATGGVGSCRFSQTLTELQCLEIVQNLCRWVDGTAESTDQKGVYLLRAFSRQAFGHTHDDLSLTSALTGPAVANFESLLDNADLSVDAAALLAVRDQIRGYRSVFQAQSFDDPVHWTIHRHLSYLETVLEVSHESGHWLLDPFTAGEACTKLIGFHVTLGYARDVEISLILLSIATALISLIPGSAAPAFAISLGLAGATSLPGLVESFKGRRRELAPSTER